mmetsp:Transcript_23029/g.51361  ORF Transcript_23029/g.51361 Transcript_23029/m.51361 type:complete len:355 (-) Transcript_23029:34-1098(-)
MMSKLLSLALFLCALAGSTAFTVDTSRSRLSLNLNVPTAATASPRRRPTTELNQEDKKRSGGFDKGVSNKLLEETVAPWRGLRLFLYGAAASGAFVSGMFTGSGVIAAMGGVRDDVDLNAEYVNLAINFGAVLLFAVLAKLDLDKGAELSASIEEKVERKKKIKNMTKSMRERERQLRDLSLNVRVTEDGELREAPVGVMQDKAKQHIILVAGPGRAIRDALRGAQLNKVNFAMTNILVVPYETGVDEVVKASKPDGGGFGDSRPSYETQAYVAEPVGEGWGEFIQAEMDTAAEQAGGTVLEQGVALVIANNGKVLRRGVGKVPWRQMVDELEEAVTGEKKESAVPFLASFIEE